MVQARLGRNKGGSKQDKLKMLKRLKKTLVLNFDMGSQNPFFIQR